MHREREKITIGKFINYYCDGISCALGEFIRLDEEREEKLQQLLSEQFLTCQESETLIEYATLKNISAGVGELNIKVQDFGMGIKMLDRYNLKGREIVSAKKYGQMPTSSLVGSRTMLDIESLVDYNQSTLSEISDFSARADVPLAINLSSDLEEIGKIVNLYSLSPAEVLESFGFLDRECFVYGLNYLDKDDQKLIKTYNKTCVFSPQDDGERGKGAINLFNFIYNQLKFGFSSGKCYNIDMLLEGKLACLNTSNLMHEGGLIGVKQILDALSKEGHGEVEIDLSDEENLENILDRKVKLEQKCMESLREKTKEIARKIKEKI